MLLPILSACGFAAAAGVAPWVIQPWPAALAAALALLAAALTMVALAIEPPFTARKDPS